MFRASNNRGFTIVELVVVIVILGIISAVAAPRFFDLQGYKEIAFKDELVSALRFAQKRAVASGEVVEVVVDPGERDFFLQYDDNNDTPVNHPAGDKYRFSEVHQDEEPPTSFILKDETIIFDALGRADSTLSPGDPQDPPINNVGYSGSGITVWRETGCVEVD
jgi:MSHA pilin protein MshC